jgi:hypothetical protein
MMIEFVIEQAMLRVGEATNRQNYEGAIMTKIAEYKEPCRDHHRCRAQVTGAAGNPPGGRRRLPAASRGTGGYFTGESLRMVQVQTDENLKR